jgi:GDP-D-mannose dehydratase
MLQQEQSDDYVIATGESCKLAGLDWREDVAID